LILGAFVVTRALAISATHLGAHFMTPDKRAEWAWVQGRSDLHVLPPPPAFVAPLVRWDAPFYLALAKEGYPPPRRDPVYHLGFFPLYPLAVRAFERISGNFFWAAFAVSNLCALLAALLMLPLGGAAAALLFLCSPGAHFLAYPYSEGLFALALAAGLAAIKSERLGTAALAGAAASATRSPGVALALALVGQSPRRLRNWAAAAGALAGVIAFMVWCQGRYGDALAFAHIQGYHRRHLSLLGPLVAFLAFDTDPDYYLVTIACLFVAVKMVRRTPAWQWITAWFLLLLPLATGTLQAMIRYQAVNLPLLCGAATLFPARTFRWLLAACLVLMLFEAFLFGKGIGHA
jgi:Mannosyltransferase (PIG-V)